MRVLAAVFTHAGRITAYISGIPLRVLERRGKQENHALVLSNEDILDRLHRLFRAFLPGGARNDSPGLGN